MVQLILAVICTGAIEVEVHQRDGAVQSGSVVSLGVDELTVQTDQDDLVIETANVKELRAKRKTPPRSDAPVRIKLRGGSMVTAAEYTTKDGAATIKLASGQIIKVAARDIELVVLSKPDKETDQNRQEILAREVAGDIVIVRRRNQNLDYVEGVLGDVDTSEVQFEYDDEWIGVKRSRIDSFRYFRPRIDGLERPRCQLVTQDGSTWQVTGLALKEGRLHLTLSGDLSVELPAESISTLKFASTSTIYLSDLEPHKVTLTPSLQIAALAEDLAELDSSEPFLPSSDESLFGHHQNLALAQSDGRLQQYEKGVAIHSRTELTYRLAGDYRQFDAITGLDPLVRKAGRVNLVIRADDKELFQIGDSRWNVANESQA